MTGIITRKRINEMILGDKLLENTDIDICMSPCSYEIRAGSYYNWDEQKDVPLLQGEMVAIAPSGFVLLGSIEKVNLPLDFLGLMYLRSTYARRGMAPWFMGLVDPGYSGQLTLPIHNLTSNLIPIKGGERMCHIVFQELPEPVEEGYKGSYQSSSGAVPSATLSAVTVIGQKIASGILKHFIEAL